MFEQSSYEPSTAAEPTPEAREGDLFKNYELKAWDLSPRIYKILGMSALANIVVLLVFAQTSLLTMKGCDSPLVGSVCQALDTVYIGSLLFGTQREVVDAEYDKTVLADADITYVDLTNVDTEKLYYPLDYLKYSDPDRYAAEQAALLNPTAIPPPAFGSSTATSDFPNFNGSQPMATPNRDNSMFATKPVYPKPPKKSVIDGELTDINGNPIGGSKTKTDSGRQGKTKNGSASNADPTTSVTPNLTIDPANNTADKKDEATQDQNGVYINKRPTDDFALQTLQRLENKQVTLDAPFKVTIQGTLGLAKDKKTIVLLNPKPVLGPNEVAGDPEMLKFAQETIIAFADAGWFGYLDKLSSKNVVIHLEQNDSTVIARLTADQPDENRAKTAASGLNALLAIGAATSVGDNKTFLGAATTGNDGKTFFVNFELPKQAFTEMVQRKLAEVKAKPKQSNQNSNTSGKSTDNFARN